MNNGTFDFNVFVKESKYVILDPKSYFSTIKTSGGISEPLIKTVIYGAVAGAFYFLWSLLNLRGLSGAMWGESGGAMVFIWSVFAAIILLFLVAVILLVISSICKGNTDFESSLRVTSAVMVMMPISAFLGFTEGINLYLGVISALGVSVFALWLFYNGLVETLKSNPDTSRIAFYILIAIFVLFMLAGLGAKRKAYQFLKGFDNPDVKEMTKDFQK